MPPPTTIQEPRPPSLTLIVAAAAAAGLGFGLAFAKALGGSSNISYALGSATGAGLAWPAIFLLFSQIVPRFRNSRSRYAVILFVSLLPLSGQALNAVLPTWRDALREKLARARAAGAPDVHFADLPKATWNEKNIPPPDREVVRVRHFTHVDGLKQIVVSTIKNPTGDTNLQPQLQGFKDGLSSQGFRFVKESPRTFGQASGVVLVGITDHGGGRRAHSVVLYAVNKQMVYSIIVISTSGPVVHHPELSDFIKSIRIE